MQAAHFPLILSFLALLPVRLHCPQASSPLVSLKNPPLNVLRAAVLVGGSLYPSAHHSSLCSVGLCGSLGRGPRDTTEQLFLKRWVLPVSQTDILVLHCVRTQ